MRVVVTGQVGLDKKPLLERAVQVARDRGFELALCNVGDRMYAEAPDVAPGRILDLPLSRLDSLRRSVFKDVLAVCEKSPHVLVNTHATFRWRHGLFYAFDYDQMKALDADLYVAIVDSVDRVHYRLVRDGHTDHTLKDLMVWREEEVLATELLSQIVRGHGRFYVLARGEDAAAAGSPVEALVRLLFEPQAKKAYLSFPMSHVGEAPDVLSEIESFRRRMKRLLVCFDPGDLEEKHLCRLAIDAVEQGRRTVEVGPPGARSAMEATDVVSIIPDIDGQIYARDFKLIDQSDMIVSLIPRLPDGRPGLSSGVERELQHAHEATRDVFVIWRPEIEPSPFITETATRVFRSTDEAVRFFLESDYAPPPPTGALFA
jgi:adenylate kinase